MLPPVPPDLVLRPAIPDDIPHIAAVFGRAFDEYLRGLGATPQRLASFWAPSIEARLAQTIVAALPDHPVAGFVIIVPPGAKESYGDRSAFPRRLSATVRAMRWSWLWRMPALFLPMALAYARRQVAKDELYLSLIAVDPQLQRRGVGQALLTAVEVEARRHRAAAILLHTASTNARARAAYARAGYELVSTVRSPWRGPADIPAYVAMRKPLVAQSIAGSTRAD